MSRHLRWLAPSLVAGLLISGAMPVRAASPLSFDDPAGDALDSRKSMDIVKVTYDVRQVNKSGPPSLVVELTLAGAPESQLATYSVDADAGEDCFVYASYRPGTVFTAATGFAAGQFFIGCGDDQAFTAAKMLVKGNLITMSVAMDSLPKPIREKGELSGIYAYTQTSEPATGILGNGWVDYVGHMPTPTDSAKTDKKFRFA